MLTIQTLLQSGNDGTDPIKYDKFLYVVTKETTYIEEYWNKPYCGLNITLEMRKNHSRANPLQSSPHSPLNVTNNLYLSRFNCVSPLISWYESSKTYFLLIVIKYGGIFQPCKQKSNECKILHMLTTLNAIWLKNWSFTSREKSILRVLQKSAEENIRTY